MKNRELREQLQRFPDEAEVGIQLSGQQQQSNRNWQIQSVQQMTQAQSEAGRKGGEVYLQVQEASSGYASQAAASTSGPGTGQSPHK